MNWFWVLAALCTAIVPCIADNNQLKNNNVLMLVDVTGSYIKQTYEITVTNTGSDAVSEYFIAHPPLIASNLIVAEIKETSTRASNTDPGVLKMVPTADGEMLQATLREPLQPGETIVLTLAQAVSNLVEPRPEVASQDSKQVLLYKGSEVFHSPYETESSELRVHSLPGFSIKRVTDTSEGTVDSGSNRDGFFSFEPVKDIMPFTNREIELLYENPRPLIKTVKIDRDIWVSHWGNSVSFEETYWLRNVGTKLKDTFSRLQLMRAAQTPKYDLNTAALKVLPITLPPNARDAYFTDLVGNVSTSSFLSTPKSSKFDVRPRYPIFGGWNYNFTIGWSHDLSTFVRSLGSDKFILKVPLLDGPVDMLYDEVNLKIILPQGADDIKISSPMGANREITVTNSYLDTVGRPTVIMSFSNIIDAQRVAEVYVTYSYTFADALRKPLSLAGTIATLFMVALISSKIDVSILRKNKAPKAN